MMKSLLAACIVLFLSTLSFAGDGDIVVISASAPSERVTARTIERVYLKRKTMWQDDSAVVPLNLPSANPVRMEFTGAVLRRSHRSLVEYWNEQHYKGVRPPMVVESEEAVKAFIREVKGSIGYIDASKLEPDLKVLYLIKEER